MTEEPTEWIAHIDQANRLYFEPKEIETPTIQTCQYFKSDACDCSKECQYGEKKEA